MVTRPSKSDQVTSVRLPVDLGERLDELARIVERSRDDLIVEALRHYVDDGMRYVAEIEETRADLSAGRAYSPDDVLARLRERGYLREGSEG